MYERTREYMKQDLQEQNKGFENQMSGISTVTDATPQFEVNSSQSLTKTSITATFVDNDFGNDLTQVQFAAGTSPSAPEWVRNNFVLGWEPPINSTADNTTHTAVWTNTTSSIVVQVPIGGWGNRPPRPPINMGNKPSLGESITVNRGPLSGTSDDPIGLWFHNFIGWFADRPTRGTFANPIATITDFTLLNKDGLFDTLTLQARFAPQQVTPLSDTYSDLDKAVAPKFDMAKDQTTAAVSNNTINVVPIIPGLNYPPLTNLTQGWSSKNNNTITVQPGIRNQIAATDMNSEDPAIVSYYKLGIMQEYDWVSLDNGSENGVQSDFLYAWRGGDAHHGIPLLIDTKGLPTGKHRAVIFAFRYDETDGITCPYVTRVLELEVFIGIDEEKKENLHE